MVAILKVLPKAIFDHHWGTQELGPRISVATHITGFNALIDIDEHYVGNITDDMVLEKINNQLAISNLTLQFQRAAKERMLALTFIYSSDQQKYISIVTNLEIN